jgi:hypothetical protein
LRVERPQGVGHGGGLKVTDGYRRLPTVTAGMRGGGMVNGSQWKSMEVKNPGVGALEREAWVMV